MTKHILPHDLTALTAIQEDRPHGARSSRAAQCGSITKTLGFGHTRAYPSGPVIINPAAAALILEANRMMDAKPDEPNIVRKIVSRFNDRWMAGDRNYTPPGRSNMWNRSHFVSHSDSGILQNTDNIGHFVHGRTITKMDIASGKTVRFRRRPEEHIVVVRNDLQIVPKDMFFRNAAKLESRRARPQARKNGEAMKGPSASVVTDTAPAYDTSRSEDD